MSYTTYALFRMPGTAEVALQVLSAAGLAKEDCQVFVHKEKLAADLRASELDGRKGLTVGVIVGVVAGAILGGLVCGPIGPIHLLHLPLASAMALGMFLGVICGALGGGIYGSGLMHGNLRKLADAFQPGQTLITAETESRQSLRLVRQIFRKHGAVTASR
jgi:hypothetical protein